MEPLKSLNAPLKAGEIEWRVQSQSKDGQKLIVVPYINNRSVMQRFDAEFGWDGWSNEITQIDGGYLCRVTVTLPDGRTVSKMDGASQTGIEPIKGGISDAMKRCAVQFGCGRDLYDYPRVMFETPDKYIPKWGGELLDQLVAKINAGGSVPPVVVLKFSHSKEGQAMKTGNSNQSI